MPDPSFPLACVLSHENGIARSFNPLLHVLKGDVLHAKDGQALLVVNGVVDYQCRDDDQHHHNDGNDDSEDQILLVHVLAPNSCSQTLD